MSVSEGLFHIFFKGSPKRISFSSRKSSETTSSSRSLQTSPNPSGKSSKDAAATTAEKYEDANQGIKQCLNFSFVLPECELHPATGSLRPRPLGVLDLHRGRPALLARRRPLGLHHPVVQQALHLRDRPQRARPRGRAQVRQSRAVREELQRDLPRLETCVK